MKLQPWQTVAFPFGALGIGFLSLAFLQEGGEQWALWAIAPFLVFAVFYVMSPQVNFWYWRRNPPPLSIGTQKLLDDHFGYYRALSPDLKKRFREHVALFMAGNEFIRPVPKDDSDAQALRHKVPEDLKAAVAAHAIQVFFGTDKYLTGKFEHFILYPHPFPTPQYRMFHTSEIFDEDGVVLFSADHLMQGLNSPNSFFSIGLYEFVRIYKKLSPSGEHAFGVGFQTPLTEKEWETLDKLSGMNRQTIAAIVGLDDLDEFGIIGHHFFAFPEKFKTILPDLYQLMTNIFHQNPAESSHPILHY
jgi:hypothetical protein